MFNKNIYFLNLVFTFIGFPGPPFFFYNQKVLFAQRRGYRLGTPTEAHCCQDSKTLLSFKTLTFISLLQNLAFPYCKPAIAHFSGIYVILLAWQFSHVFDPISVLCDTGVISHMLHFLKFLFIYFFVFL